MTVLQRQCNTHRPVGWALMPCLSTRGLLSGLWVKEIGAPLHGLLGLWVEATQFLRFPHPVCYSQPKSSLCRDPSVGRVHAHTHTQSQTLPGLCSRCLQTQGTQAGLHGNQHSARRQAGQDSTAVSALAACWNPQGSLHSHQRPGHPEQLIQLVHVGPGFVMFSKLPR